MKHVRVNNANIEPVFFAYPDNEEIDQIVAKYTARKPEYDFIAPLDGFGHTFWVIDDDADIDRITGLFAQMPALYIAGRGRPGRRREGDPESEPQGRRGIQLFHGGLLPGQPADDYRL